MNPDARRSACDRCRGQKLRCVRPFQARGLSPCERCLKAGAECTNSLSYAQRKLQEARQSASFLDQRSSRIYESVSVPRAPPDFAESIDSIPAKRKLTQPFLESAHYVSPVTIHPSVIGGRSGETVSRAAPKQPPTSLSATDQNPDLSRSKTLGYGVEPLDFDVRLSPEATGHGSDQFMDMLFDDPKVTTARTRPEHLDEEPPPQETSGTASPPLGTKEDCLHCLSELSSQILRDSSKMRAMPLPDILSFSAWPDNSKGQPEKGLQNSIGRLLELTQAYLNILHCLKLATASAMSHPSSSSPSFHHRSPRSPSNDSDCSYSEYWNDPEHLAVHNQENPPRTGPENLISFPDAMPDPASKQSVGSSGVDMPTTLTILTCYIWLLHAYGTIFHRIHAALSADSSVPFPSLPVPSLSTLASSTTADLSTRPSSFSSSGRFATQLMPSVLPGLHIGGFDLNSHRDLQLEIIVQLSSRMLGRIEELLGISLVSSQSPGRPDVTWNGSDNGANLSGRKDGGGILDNASASALLEVMLKHHNLGYFKDVDGGAGSVKQTLNDIRAILRRAS
ncbi:hypothetical protein BO94DRAFT_208180 [Aspergillus sclerotioniger CBS 115572]|uniref:Zn(2)-C6 fungal-type domain-containing protein n=1 Tax=Aspergillus sclerotioniger CBS 115572 TaxID=1450535 RepID=A0A317VR75_9EURO|nr:hypothetical protein BO94DRAFT_208180 [Aspergillus sclerotioniger CBS 115572]PWY76059.1 hypothetical protein BO94DRAFT_208180 [Aspergillus sclerotioniger CBS 115572]